MRWSSDGRALTIIDQRCLPTELVERELRTLDEVRDAIAVLAVRGAPAIGVAAAIGLVVSLQPYANDDIHLLRARLDAHANILGGTRPTAVNLPWAMQRMRACAEARPAATTAVLMGALRAEATAILDEDRRMCDAIGRYGLSLLGNPVRVLTHCNAGALATAGIGTALAPVYMAHAAGRAVHVFATETRPLLQGSRLTAWELQRAGIPVTVLADGMAAAEMRAGTVDAVLVGADRIVANGDTANKIGTYALAVAAQHHGIPFYVCAPWSTVDHATPTGDAIVIEERDGGELRRVSGVPTAPVDVPVRNPAFDVTPNALITAVVTDRGIYRTPYRFVYGSGA